MARKCVKKGKSKGRVVCRKWSGTKRKGRKGGKRKGKR